MPPTSLGPQLLDLTRSPLMRYLRGRAFVRDLLLVLLTWSALGGVLGHELVNFDDGQYVERNLNVACGLDLGSLGWAFSTFHASNWHPFTWISLQLDAEWWGPSAATFHRTNLLLHMANVILLAEVLRRLTGRFWPAAAVAALFAVHPLHVESVAWVSERKDVLSTLFGLLALGAYVHYARRPSPGRMFLVALAQAASLLAKPMLVTLPVLLLLLDYWPLRRLAGSRPEEGPKPFASAPAWHLLLEKTPLFALAAGSCVMTILSQSQGNALKSLAAYPFGLRCANALNSVLVYLGQTFWPTDLVAFYPYPHQGLPWETTLLEAVLFLGISGAAVYLARSRPYLLVGWLWYLVALAPVIGLVQVGRQAHADRYTYVPLIGIFLAFVWGVSDLLGSRRRVLQGALLAGSLAVCVVLTRVQAGYWANSRALWQHTLAVTDNNAFARMGYGQALLTAQQPEAALEQYGEALQIDSEMDRAWLLLAQLHEGQRRWYEALACYRQAAVLAPNNQSYQASVSRLLAQHSAGQDHNHP